MGVGPTFEGELAQERRIYPFKKSLEPAEATARKEGANLTDGVWTDLQGLYLVLSHLLGSRVSQGLAE